MKKIIINNNINAVRILSPFAYKDPIKALEKSTEARVTVDGVKVHVSAVTSGIDVKARTGRKYHLYFYATPAAAKLGTVAREFIPITAEEFTAYRNDPAFIFDIKTVAQLEAAAATLAEPAQEQPAPEVQPAAEQAAEQGQKPARRAKR
jgi:hypothetical protein